MLLSTEIIIRSLFGAVTFSLICAFFSVLLSFILKLIYNIGNLTRYYIKCFVKRSKIEIQELIEPNRHLSEAVSIISLLFAGILFAVFNYVYLDGEIKLIPSLVFITFYIISLKLLSKITEMVHIFFSKFLFFALYPFIQVLYCIFGFLLSVFGKIKNGYIFVKKKQKSKKSMKSMKYARKL